MKNFPVLDADADSIYLLFLSFWCFPPSPPDMTMATNTINLPSLRLLPSSSHPHRANRTIPSHLSSNSHLSDSLPLNFSLVSLKPRSSTKPRSSLVVFSALTHLSQTELVPLPPDAEQLSQQFPSAAGVYAVYDGEDELQFIGISRNIAASVLGHWKSVPELCRSVKVCFLRNIVSIVQILLFKTFRGELLNEFIPISIGKELLCGPEILQSLQVCL